MLGRLEILHGVRTMDRPGYGVGNTTFHPAPDGPAPLVDAPVPTLVTLTYSAVEQRIRRWIAEGFPDAFVLAVLDPSADVQSVLQTPVVGFTMTVDETRHLLIDRERSPSYDTQGS